MSMPWAVVGANFALSAIVTDVGGVAIDLTGGSAKFGYLKPDGTTGTFTATLDTPAQGVIHYDVQTSDVTLAGQWVFWTEATTSGGKVYISAGTPVKVLSKGATL